MKRFLFVIAWTLPFLSSPALAANLFPLENGNSWTYRDAANGETFTVRVGTPSIINGTVYYPLRGYTANRLFVRMDEQFNQLVAWDEVVNREVTVISFQPHGLWWQAPFRPCDQEGQALPMPGSHSGPVGVFEPVLELRYRSFGCTDAIEAEQFALNYGLLRRIIASGSASRQFDLISASIGGMTIGISAPFLVPNSGSVARTTLGENHLTVGYARIQSAGLPPQTGLAMFAYRENGVLVSEASVPAVSTMTGGRIFAETTNRVRTGLAIANPNAQPVTVSFYFTDELGQNFGMGATTLKGYGQLAGFLDEQAIFPGNVSTPISAARTFTFQASRPVSAIALRGLMNERSEFLLTTLPIADLTHSSFATVIIPHFAEGGGWATEIALVNPGNFKMNGTLRFFDKSGASIESRQYAIAPRSSVMVRKDSSNTLVTAGSIHIDPDPTHEAPVALNIFSFRSSGITVTATGVPALAPVSSMSLYAEYSSTLRSGYAFANPDVNPVTINYELFFDYGISTGIKGTIDLPGNGQTALFLDELLGDTPVPARFKGVLRIATPGGAAVSVVGLRGRTNERGDFLVSTTTSYADLTGGPSETFLPHLADGDGYTMEFIFLGRNIEPVNATMYFFSPDGQPLSVSTFK